MNLHKAKGLEAPIVFLANPGPLTEHAVDKHVVRVSEDEGRGRPPRDISCFAEGMLSAGRRTSFPSRPDWEKAAEEEKRYQAAEQIRLMYVAATRAKNMLVVSTYAGNARIKPWMTIDEALAGVPELAAAFPGSAPSAVEGADGGPGGPADNEDRPRGIAARKREKADISTADVDRARKEIGANIRRAGQPSYAVESVTALALKDKKPGERRGPGFGPVWGRLVHRVLEAIGSGQLNLKGLDLFLENILAAEESDFADKDGLREHVEAILGSPFWARVIKADKRYFEIPFAIKTDEAELGVTGKDGSVIPVILRGTIDLVFREGGEGGREDKRGGGWVIADYKTDRIPLNRRGARVGGPVARHRAGARHVARVRRRRRPLLASGAALRPVLAADHGRAGHRIGALLHLNRPLGESPAVRLRFRRRLRLTTRALKTLEVSTVHNNGRPAGRCDGPECPRLGGPGISALHK